MSFPLVLASTAFVALAGIYFGRRRCATRVAMPATSTARPIRTAAHARTERDSAAEHVSPSDAAAAWKVVGRYAALLEQWQEPGLRSVQELPATVEEIKAALVTVARHGLAVANSGEQELDTIRASYIALAQFVDSDEAERHEDLRGAVRVYETTGRASDADLIRVLDAFGGAYGGRRASLATTMARLEAEFDSRVVPPAT